MKNFWFHEIALYSEVDFFSISIYFKSNQIYFSEVDFKSKYFFYLSSCNFIKIQKYKALKEKEERKLSVAEYIEHCIITYYSSLSFCFARQSLSPFARLNIILIIFIGGNQTYRSLHWIDFHFWDIRMTIKRPTRNSQSRKERLYCYRSPTKQKMLKGKISLCDSIE